jgi:hypothetical protein
MWPWYVLWTHELKLWKLDSNGRLLWIQLWIFCLYMSWKFVNRLNDSQLLMKDLVAWANVLWHFTCCESYIVARHFWRFCYQEAWMLGVYGVCTSLNKTCLIVVLGLQPLRKTMLEEALKKIVGKSSRSQIVQSGRKRYQLSDPCVYVLVLPLHVITRPLVPVSKFKTFLIFNRPREQNLFFRIPLTN